VLVFLILRNTTMSFRKIALSVAAIAALSPVISYASPEKASVKACAAAFAASMATPGTTAPAYRLDYRSNAGSTLGSIYPTNYTFTLEAHEPKTGLPIARALCSTDSHGAVTAIAAMPLDEKPAALAARF
jgi:hypothetical protein